MLRVSQLLEDFDARLRAILRLFADQGDVDPIRSDLANNLLRISCQRFDHKILSTVSKGILQQLAGHVISRDDEHPDWFFGLVNGCGRWI